MRIIPSTGSVGKEGYFISLRTVWMTITGGGIRCWLLVGGSTRIL